MKKLFLFLAVILAASAAEAKLKLPAIFGDHMVLQRGKSAVFGWADPGQKVTVSIAGKKAAGKADAEGKFRVPLALGQAGGPYALVVTSDESVTLTDVLVGDVWMGSGQSNMEFATKASSDASTEIPKADFPKIRLFTVEKTASFTPVSDVKGSWQVCSPGTVGDFSAVAYHFGKELHEALKVPVGLVAASWGGTGAEDWTPRADLDADPELAKLAKDWEANQVQRTAWTEGFPYDLSVSDIRLIPKDKSGKEIQVPVSPQDGKGTWSASVKPGCTGDVETGPAMRFHGKMMGGGWGSVSTNLGSPTIDLSGYQAIEFQVKGTGSYKLTLGQPSIGDYDYYAMTQTFTAGDSPQKVHVEIADLKQGGWGSPKAFTPESITTLNFSIQVPYWPDLPSVAYNAMIDPLTGFPIKGVVWYQGESNAGRAGQYAQLLSGLISGWRKAWGERFPFIIIQLPNFMARQAAPVESGWADLREAQWEVSQKVPAVGLVTTIELGEAENIHPKNKTEVGRRAALWALKNVYGKKIEASGPQFMKAKRSGGKVLVTFAGKGLKTRDGGEVTGFALGDQDGRYHWAKAKIQGNGVLVWSEDVPEPYDLRYAWADNPDCNLVGSNGLPAGPFHVKLAERPVPKPGADNYIPPPPEN
ncbi:MAG TPA: CIA30 family protein [bacterium]|nr:CIA30 family protein [bacterium]